jgi:type I restriction enzyme M protein
LAALVDRAGDGTLSDNNLNWIANFIWGIADDVLRDVYVRGKYRDVILPMTVIRRLDAVLEPTKQAVLKMKEKLDRAGMTNQHSALCQASHEAFYNTSKFTLRDLQARAKQQQLKADFEAYLEGYSPNVQEILSKFKLYNQIPTLVEADILGSLIEKFLDPAVNLGPKPVMDGDDKVRLPGLDNHAMGTIFEELIRRFNEENNEEAGEHFTPRDVVRLMAKLIFLPIAEKIESGTYLLYDGACGTGGMLTVAEESLLELAQQRGKDVSIYLFGQEVNPETFAITKADLLLKGEGGSAENMAYGSSLSADNFPAHEFDFMLSNPPYGKSWKTDLERMGGKGDIKDPRFVIEHAGDSEYSLITRSSDGQLMFLANMVSKMKHTTELGSRIAEVHNGSSLFTGDAGQGESNIRRWIIETDRLEAIIALPLNMFYNTGIATYIWVLSNKKPEHRQGKVQLIDATEWYKPLRKNLGKKNCEFGEEDIKKICDTFLAFEETAQSKIFPNEAFGYWKIVVERPLRLKVDLSEPARARFRRVSKQAGEESLADLVDHFAGSIGPGPHLNFNDLSASAEREAKALDLSLTAKRWKLIQSELAVKDEAAAPVIKKAHKPGKAEADPIHGRFEEELVEPPLRAAHAGLKAGSTAKTCVVEYEPDSELRDTEQVPLLEAGGIEAFFRREVLSYVPDAWVDEEATKIGYEISFTRYFYKPKPLRTLEQIRADIEALEKESEGLLGQIMVETEDAR